MKTLIVGGAGFVGAHLIQRLTSKGKDVEATCLENERIDAPIPAHIADIRDSESIGRLIAEIKPDAIFHLAALSSVAQSWQEPSMTIDINVKGVVNLLDAVRKESHACRVILIGSGEQYGAIGPDDVPIKEDVKFSPGNIYAVTKAAQDMIGDVYAKAYNMDIIRVRAFNHIGPGQSPQFVVSDFCRQVAMIENGLSEPTLRVGNLSSKRDFTDVRDVVRAYDLLCERGKSGEAYNVGSGAAIEIRAILDTILSLSNKKINVEIDRNKFRPIDVPIIEADTRKLREATGWTPKYDLRGTLEATLEYWRARVRVDR
jgi:GDP-4-dehydro-6-deoxy-D-mannose reductase